jgi:hypothetical protein
MASMASFMDSKWDGDPLSGRGWLCRISSNGKGPVAQLGERYNGIVEVIGSIPFGSI